MTHLEKTKKNIQLEIIKRAESIKKLDIEIKHAKIEMEAHSKVIIELSEILHLLNQDPQK